MAVAPHLCGHPLGRRRHVCVLYSAEELEYRVLAPYVRDGVEGRDRVLNVIAPGGREQHLDRLLAAGIDARGAERQGTLLLKDWNQTYLAGGGFSADAMSEKVRAALQDVSREGFARLRCWGNMGWLAEIPPAIDEVVRYEKHADTLAEEFPENVFVCAYDTRVLPPQVVGRLAALHPVVVFDGTMYENSSM